MKKALVICSLALLSFIPASAQFSWGIRGGLNLVNNDITSVNKQSALDKDNYTGFFIGPMAELQIPIIGIGIDAALLYSQKGLELQEGNMKNQSLSVPVYLKYTFGLGNLLGIFGQVGPQFDYKLGDLNKTIEVSNDSGNGKDVQEFILNQYTWSINIGAGVKLLNHIQAAVNYNIPLSKEGTYNLYEDATEGNYKDAVVAGSEAFKASTLQFIFTLTF
jgi:hypothetical protein